MRYNSLDPATFSTFSEAQVVEVFDEDNKSLLFYRSPDKSSEENDQALNALIREISNSRRFINTIICGDFNYRNLDWGRMTNTTSTINKEYRFIETIKDSFLVQHIKAPTRGRGTNQASLLDLVLTDDICCTPWTKRPQPSTDFF